MTDAEEDPPGDRGALSAAEMTELLGFKPGPKLEMVLIGSDRMFHREVDGSWLEYPRVF